MSRLVALMLMSFCLCQAAPGKALQIYFIDVEGGQSTLFVSPKGQSLLIDTGWPGNEGRDAQRIIAAAKDAHLKKIDYVLITHFHVDHVGGSSELARRFPIGAFIDHGASVEKDKPGTDLYNDYANALAHTKHIVVKPGDKLPVKGFSAEVLSAAGKLIETPLAGAGDKNSLCGSDAQRPVDPTENAQSVGTLVTFGKFRALDMGDLTWNKEMELVCPANRVGKVDLYIVSHHGMDMSGSATFVHALGARVAIMDNGSRKGGTAVAYNAIKDSPGIADIWQLHRAVMAGKSNSEENLEANVAESPDSGFGIKVTANEDGSFVVKNLRNGFEKSYGAK